MDQIKRLRQGETASKTGSDRHITQLFDGPFRKIMEVGLSNGAVLSKHHADVPITVYCVSGEGEFYAGEALSEVNKLSAGSLITLDAGIEHEVRATPEIRLIVSKFKAA